MKSILPRSKLHRWACLWAALTLATGCRAESAQEEAEEADDRPSATVGVRVAQRPIPVTQLPPALISVAEPEPALLPPGPIPTAGAPMLTAVAATAEPPGTAAPPPRRKAEKVSAAEPEPGRKRGPKKRNIKPTAVAVSKPAAAPEPTAVAPREDAPAAAPPPPKKVRQPFGAVKVVSVPRTNRLRGLVPWRHRFHYDQRRGIGIPCVDCHHDAKPEEGKVEYKACAVCHKATATPGVISAKDAYHSNCIECHQKAVSEDPGLGARAPIRCNDCHKKK